MKNPTGLESGKGFKSAGRTEHVLLRKRECSWISSLALTDTCQLLQTKLKMTAAICQLLQTKLKMTAAMDPRFAGCPSPAAKRNDVFL